MSEIKVNKISPRTNCGTVQLGDSGDTITIPSGATITNNGTAAGFGATGAASWDTTVKTSGFTAVSGVGYFVNTTAGAITVTLPASPSAGDVVAVSDYANIFATNNLTLGRNGSNIGGVAADSVLIVNGAAVTLVYVDATKGWIVTDSGNQSEASELKLYIAATGGTETTSGNFKIHTFTGPGTFTVCSVGNPAGSDTVDYLVVAGGGSGGTWGSGGGGAGGFRESGGTASGCYTTSPLGSCVSALPVTATGYPITVGGGGTGQAYPTRTSATPGSNSTFSTIASAGGGRAAACGTPGATGGSGGGGYISNNSGSGLAGNTPPVSPPQGNNGGNASCAPSYAGGGGGGATAVGANSTPSAAAAGGAGATTSISSSPTAYAGGGGGGSAGPGARPGGAGGTGGGGTGGESGPGASPGGAGTTNTGGGGGGGGASTTAGTSSGAGGNGGSGIVIIRYKFQ
jgi:hypothetical protein